MRSSRDLNLALAPPSNLPAAEPSPAADRVAVLTVAGQIRPHGIGGVPVLKLMGDWLASAGFPTGTYAVLAAGEGRIVIEAKGHLSDPGAVEHRRHLRETVTRP
jgi:hypothetical protein